MSALEIALLLATAFGLAYWFRGYFKPLTQAFARWRQLFQTLRQATSIVNPESNPKRPARNIRVIDVSAARRNSKTVCPACGDDLSEAQVQALQTRRVRCPGSGRVGQECPFYGERIIN